MPAIALNSKSTAAVVRQVLKKAYPGIKFSVITERGSMVSSVRVTWTDGPRRKDVDALLGPFEMGRFDGMTDSYDYNKTADRQLLVNGVHYEAGVKYVSTERRISAALANRIIPLVAAYWGGVDDVPVAIAEPGYDGFKFEDPSFYRRMVRDDLQGPHCEWSTAVRSAAEGYQPYDKMEG